MRISIYQLYDNNSRGWYSDSSFRSQVLIEQLKYEIWMGACDRVGSTVTITDSFLMKHGGKSDVKERFLWEDKSGHLASNNNNNNKNFKSAFRTYNQRHKDLALAHVTKRPN